MSNKIKLKYLQQILMLIPGNVYWKDKDGHYLGCNSQQLQVAKIKSLSEILGKTDKDLYSEEIARCIMKNDREIIEKQQEKTLEEVGIDAEGNETVYLTKKSPLYYEFGKVIGLVGIGLDITEKKKAEEVIIQAKIAAEEANKAKTEFIMNMSHDLRTPLAGIIGLSNIQAKEETDTQDKNLWMWVHDAGEQLLELLNSVIELTAADHIVDRIKQERIDLIKLAEELYNLM